MFNCEPNASLCLPELSVLGTMCFGFVLGWMLYFVNRYRKDVSLADLGTIVTALAGATILSLINVEETGNATLVGAYGMGIFLGFMAYGFTLYRIVKAYPEAYDTLWFVDGRRKGQGDTGYRMPEPSDEINRPMSVETHTVKRRFRGPAPAPVTFGLQATSTNNTTQYTSAIASVRDAIGDVADAIAAEPDKDIRMKLREEEDTLFALLDELSGRQLLQRLSSSQVSNALHQIDAATARLNSEASKLATASAKLTQAASIIAAATDLGSKVKTAFE